MPTPLSGFHSSLFPLTHDQAQTHFDSITQQLNAFVLGLDGHDDQEAILDDRPTPFYDLDRLLSRINEHYHEQHTLYQKAPVAWSRTMAFLWLVYCEAVTRPEPLQHDPAIEALFT